MVIDVCREHGVWFDADELARILDWVRAGGKFDAERQTAAEAERKARLDEISRQFQRDRQIARGVGDFADTSPSLGDVLVQAAAEIFLPWWLR